MKASRSTLAFGLVLSATISSTAVLAADSGEQLLLARADYWRQHHRPDLASGFLDKLLTVNPRQPDALYQRAVLARDAGKGGDAQVYADRLRLLVHTDARAAELAAVLAGGVAPAQATAMPGQPAGSSGALVTATVDSDDLLPPAVPAAPSVPAPAQPTPKPAQPGQVAALPQTTVSDGDSLLPTGLSAVRGAGSPDLGFTARTVQVAQVELQPPPVIDGYQRPAVSAYSADDTLEMQIDRNLQYLEGQANPSLIAGIGFRGHSGDDGFDRLNELGGSFEGSFSPWYTGTARVAVLPVWLDAGTVSSSNLSQFGTNTLLAARGAALVGSRDQTASGVGILGSYSLNDFSGQFGTSPLGFPVVNLVGNVAYNPKFLDNTLSVRVEGLREPVTNSVLSYAGTHASLTTANALSGGAFGNDTTWGGVVKTGGHASVFYDNQLYGAYGGAGLASLTGKNVADNDQIDALLGAYFRPWKTDDWAIRTGISVYYTHFNRNLSGFTFGQGGYFSPQNYIAVTFPVEYTGHADNWSWLAAAAVGVQHFNSDSSPIFPNNPFAQTALANVPGAQTFLSGQTETGPAFNLKGQLEYAIDNSTSIGVSASLDNANNYVEGIGKIYLRKTFDWFAPIAVKSDPQSIVSRDQPMGRL